MKQLRRCLLASLGLMLALSPAVAFGAASVSPGAALLRPLAAATPDSFEPDDNVAFATATLAGATDLTPQIPHDSYGYPMFGQAAYTRPHTISPETTSTPDIDWYKVTVTPKDLEMSAFSLMIDAYSADGGDTVIEAYTAAETPGSGGEGTPTAHNDDNPWFGRSSSLMFRPETPGTYYFRVRAYRGDGYQAAPFSYDLRIKVGQTTRVAGVDRVDTANRIADIGWRDTDLSGASVPTITIASGYNYPDALAGAALAGCGSGSPLLLTKPNELPASVMDSLKRRSTKGVYLLGSPSTIGTAVEETLTANGINVVRLAGTDRVRTAAAVAREVAKLRPDPVRFAFIAFGWNFPDALAATPLAYANEVPVLLTHQSHLDTETAMAIKDLGITDVVVLGGPGSVGNEVVHTLALPTMLNGDEHILRIAGLDRYDTAVRLARWAVDRSGPGTHGDGSVGTTATPEALFALSYDRVAFASGEKYPDALAGGAAVGRVNGPLLLTKRLTMPPVLFGADGELLAGQTQYFDGPAIGRSFLFGGADTVSDGVFTELDQFTGFAGPDY